MDEFKELVGESKEKKNFIGGLIKIFTILSSTETPALTKIKKLIRTNVKSYFGTMARTKATVRRLNRPTFVAVPG